MYIQLLKQQRNVYIEIILYVALLKFRYKTIPLVLFYVERYYSFVLQFSSGLNSVSNDVRTYIFVMYKTRLLFLCKFVMIYRLFIIKVWHAVYP